MQVYSLCQPETVPPEFAARIVQISSLAMLDQVLHG
jgi:hypothetical protein